MTTIFEDWSSETTKAFQQGTVVAHHRLNDSELFSDQSLERLLELHPDALSMVYAMPTSEKSEATFREGDLRGLSGHDIMAAVTQGELWVQLLKLNKTHPQFKALEQQILTEMKRLIPGFRVLRCNLSILISSPTINVSYHADIPRNALWQIRGSKRVYLYPPIDPYISKETIEDIYLGQQQEAIPYSPELDSGAKVVDLKPGMLATWPVNGPHRIENDGEPSVSLVMEYFQPHSFIRYGVMYANGIFRHRFGRPLKSSSHSGAVAVAKSLVGFVFKALKLSKPVSRARVLEFEVSRASPTGYRDIEPRPRDF